jgi:hypothetical protein
VNKEATKKSEARAEFFLSLAKELVHRDVDWATKYRIARATQQATASEGTMEVPIDDEDELFFLPSRQKRMNCRSEGVDVLLSAITTDQCNPCSFDRLPVQINKKSQTCQICNFELRKPKWKGVVMCKNHGERLCTNIVLAREKTMPKLYKSDGTVVSDYSWVCNRDASCWTKFHEF